MQRIPSDSGNSGGGRGKTSLFDAAAGRADRRVESAVHTRGGQNKQRSIALASDRPGAAHGDTQNTVFGVVLRKYAALFSGGENLMDWITSCPSVVFGSVGLLACVAGLFLEELMPEQKAKPKQLQPEDIRKLKERRRNR